MKSRMTLLYRLMNAYTTPTVPRKVQWGFLVYVLIGFTYTLIKRGDV